MKIELNAGGIGGSMTINGFQSDFSSFVTKSEKVIASFKTVKQQVYNTRSGVGTLRSGLDQLQNRIIREERKIEKVKVAQKTAEDFVDLAIRVDKQVASLVNKNKNQFYQKYPHLKPVKTTEEKAWYERAWDWICDKGEEVVDGIKRGFENFIEGAKGALKWLCDSAGKFAKLVIESHILAWKLVIDGAQKLWNSAVAFYREHKEIIDKIVSTVVIVVGAIASIAAVVLTGGLALVPLLSLFTTASIATTISLVVAGIAVASTVGASLMNIADTWLDVDNGIFNAIQTTLNITSTFSNLFYSVGNLYNSFNGVHPSELRTFKNQNFTSEQIKISVKQDRQILKFQKVLRNYDGKNPNIVKGNYGEMMQDKYMRIKGYSRVTDDAVTDYLSKTHQGIDGIYRNKDQFVIGDAKYNTARLSITKDHTKQMSGEWIEKRLYKNLDRSWTEQIINSDYVSQVFQVFPDGTFKVLLLDDYANVIGSM